MEEKNKKAQKEQKILDALYKKAVGYKVNEKNEEYVLDSESGKMVLCKLKVCKKNIPPDTTALKILMEMEALGDNVENLTDEEIRQEKLRLLGQLKEENYEDS